jgi:hypothetical protein
VAPLDLRVNTLKAKREDVLETLQRAGISAAITPHSALGLRIEGRPAVNAIPAFRDGLFEVQDEGSQLLASLVDARRGEMVVDFCAGAGGKTLALGAAMRNTGRLYAFDTSGHRLHALKPRLARSGLSNVHTVQIAHERDSASSDWLARSIACSSTRRVRAWYTLRRNPDLKWRQSPATVAQPATATANHPGWRCHTDQTRWALVCCYGTRAACSILKTKASPDIQRGPYAVRSVCLPRRPLCRLRVERPNELTQGGFQLATSPSHRRVLRGGVAT